MCDIGRLRGGIGGEPRRPGQIPGRAVGVPSGVRDWFIVTSPRVQCPTEFDRAARPIVVRARLFEEWQHVLGAIGSPKCEEMVICVAERAATTKRDQPWIANLTEDHRVKRMPVYGSGVPRAEIVIVGAGIAGIATAWALTERGVTDVVIVDRGRR